MKTHLQHNVGKGPCQFHQGQARFLFGGFLLSHERMTTGPLAFFHLGSRVRTEGLLTKGETRNPVDFSSSLFRGFLVDELHDTGFIQLEWRVTGPRVGWLRRGSGPTTLPVFYVALFYRALFLFVPCLGCTGIQLSYLDGHPFHRTNTLRPLRFKTFSTRNNESSDTCTFCTSGS